MYETYELNNLLNNSKFKSLLIYTDWLFSIRTYTYLIMLDGNWFNARKRNYRLVRRSQQMHPRDSRYSSHFFVTQLALSTTRPTIDPTKSLLFPSHFLPYSHCHSLLPSFSFSSSFSLSWFPLDLFMISRHVSFHLLRSLIPSPHLFLFLSLPFCHFQFQSPSFLSSLPIPSTSLFLSTSIPLPLSLYLFILFLFTLFYSIYSTYLLAFSHHCANFYPYLSPLFLFTLTFSLLFSFIPVLHCLNFIYFFRIRIWFNKVGGHVLPIP